MTDTTNKHAPAGLLPAQYRALRRYKPRRPDVPKALWPQIVDAALVHDEGFNRRNDTLTTERGFTHALQVAADRLKERADA